MPKFQEIAGYFKGYPGTKLWQNLRYLDPNNGRVYDEAKKNRDFFHNSTE